MTKRSIRRTESQHGSRPVGGGSLNRKTTAEAGLPEGLREVLERQRLSLRALFRSLDRLHLVQDIPAELHALFELDADLAEALWALDQPIGRLDLAAMTRDTTASLAELPEVLWAFLGLFDARDRARLMACAVTVRDSLYPSDAYLQIPGRDSNQG